ncbi:hypothetical protein [Fimbriiglobus ruber]|uniref:Uncharacterized protein n=1 Tax=Fimbriiglobus ruber TaxID=1908690 RepID=A0A225EE08_9BACT|nr:hypothetical protein [Fimbriiglobus ruber]OWK46547.1 hypothetical protein FRUB_00246 [Fimbriiglobus ruber]
MEPLSWYRIAAPVSVYIALLIYAAVRPNIRSKAVVFGATAMAVYGGAQDQISARLCPEYFTVLHNPIPGLTDPTLLALAWGFLGAMGGGVAVGYAAALAATLGPRPQLTFRELIKPILFLIATVGTASAVTGGSVYISAEQFDIRVDPFLDRYIPVERQRGAFVVACYHLVAYVTAIIGSVVMCVWIGFERARRAGVGGATAPLPPDVRPV